MTSRPVRAAALTCHPATPSAAVRGIVTRVCRPVPNVLEASWVIDSEASRLKVPEPRAPRIADGLWRHTCCELFVARKGEPGYHEFNFSPSGEWAAYAFEGYRAPTAGAAPGTIAPQVAVRRSGEVLELDAVIRLDRLSPAHVGAELALAISVVAEAQDGGLSYWALRHPPGKPDFHHAAAFALDLPRAHSTP